MLLCYIFRSMCQCPPVLSVQPTYYCYVLWMYHSACCQIMIHTRPVPFPRPYMTCDAIKIASTLDFRLIFSLTYSSFTYEKVWKWKGYGIIPSSSSVMLMEVEAARNAEDSASQHCRYSKQFIIFTKNCMQNSHFIHHNYHFFVPLPNLKPLYEGILESKGLKLTLNISHAGWVVLVYLQWFRCNSLLKVSRSLKSQKITNSPYFGGSKSFKVIDIGTHKSSSAVLVMISSKSVAICNRSQARRANSGKKKQFLRGTPVWCPRSRGIFSPSGTKFAHGKLETMRYHIVKTRSLCATNRYGIVTDRQTDRQNYDTCCPA